MTTYINELLLGLVNPLNLCGSWTGVERLPTGSSLRVDYFHGLFYPPHFKTAGAQPVDQYALFNFFEETMYKTLSKAYILLQNSKFRDFRTPYRKEEHF